MARALLSIAALRFRWPAARPTIWLFVVATVAGLANALRRGMAEHPLATANDVSRLILTCYVPVLWLSTLMIVWLLTSKEAGPVARTARPGRARPCRFLLTSIHGCIYMH